MSGKTLFKSILGSVALSAAAIATAAFPGQAVLAQDSYPLTPDASLCTVEPRTVEEMQALFVSATPVSEEELAANNVVQLGVPADDATIDEVSAVIVQAFACQNAGDFARFFALLTDETIVTYFPWIAGMLLDEAMVQEMFVATPADPEFMQTILAVGGVTSLADGSVSASIIFDDPNAGEQPSALILTFTQVGGEWRVSHVIDFHADEE